MKSVALIIFHSFLKQFSDVLLANQSCIRQDFCWELWPNVITGLKVLYWKSRGRHWSPECTVTHIHTQTNVSLYSKGIGKAGGNSASTWHEEIQACQSSYTLLPCWEPCFQPQRTVEGKQCQVGLTEHCAKRSVQGAICLLSIPLPSDTEAESTSTLHARIRIFCEMYHCPIMPVTLSEGSLAVFNIELCSCYWNRQNFHWKVSLDVLLRMH